MRQRLQTSPHLGVTIEASTTGDRPEARGLLGKAAQWLGALPAGLLAGAVSGAFFGGVAGRVLMRVIFLLDKSHEGAKTDFATAGEITLGGSATLLLLCVIFGTFGGAVYVGIRRWLPWRSLVARGAFLGLLMVFGPTILFLGRVDLQIFEPALPIFAAFIVLVVFYGVTVAVVTDRLRPMSTATPGPRVKLAARWIVGLAAVALMIVAALMTYDVYDNAGTCLSADDEGNCGVRVTGD